MQCQVKIYGWALRLHSTQLLLLSEGVIEITVGNLLYANSITKLQTMFTGSLEVPKISRLGAGVESIRRWWVITYN